MFFPFYLAAFTIFSYSNCERPMMVKVCVCPIPNYLPTRLTQPQSLTDHLIGISQDLSRTLYQGSASYQEWLFWRFLNIFICLLRHFHISLLWKTKSSLHMSCCFFTLNFKSHSNCYIFPLIQYNSQAQQNIQYRISMIKYQQDNSFRQIYNTAHQTSNKLQSVLINIQNKKLSPNDRQQNNRKKKNPLVLKNLIMKKKVDTLTTNFIRKLQKNASSRKPIDFEDLNITETPLLKLLKQTEGIFFSGCSLALWNFITIIQLIIMIFINTILIPFPQLDGQETTNYFRIIGIIIFLVDIIINFITQRYEGGKKLVMICEIASFYLKDGFPIDILCLIIYPLGQLGGRNMNVIISFIALVKVWNCIKRFEKFEYLFLGISKLNECYYRLLKVILTNFIIGHFLSIFLNLLTQLNSNKNWQTQFGIANEPWLIKYIWGYYWGTNIMLTVGFGDISAKNHHQALFLIFIETFSCITLAYNISNVGSLISQLQISDNIKKSKLKTFNRMSQQNQITPQLSMRISNLIEQSFEIKQKFQFEEQDLVLQSLPPDIHSQYRKEANRLLFDNIGFLNNLSKKSLLKLAETINRKIAHPNEVIRKKDQIAQFMVVQDGSICLAYKKNKSELNGKVIEKINVNHKEKPKVISLDFIKAKRIDYELKSQGYSVVYYLDRQDFINALRQIQIDFQLFCNMRDKDNYIEGQNEVYQCQFCPKQYHTKFKCSKLHFIPIYQHVINTYLRTKTKFTNSRKYSLRHQNKSSNQSLKSFKSISQIIEQFIEDCFTEDYIKQLIKIKKYKKQQQMQQKISKSVFQINKKMKKSNVVQPQQQSLMTKIQEMLHKQSKVNMQFWELECDEAKNYKYYMPNQNVEYKCVGVKILKSQ